jgi:hypothetical protein
MGDGGYRAIIGTGNRKPHKWLCDAKVIGKRAVVICSAKKAIMFSARFLIVTVLVYNFFISTLPTVGFLPVQ